MTAPIVARPSPTTVNIPPIIPSIVPVLSGVGIESRLKDQNQKMKSWNNFAAQQTGFCSFSFLFPLNYWPTYHLSYVNH